jgi:rubredoxin
MEKAKTESEKETPIGRGQLIADIMVRKPPRRVQCRVCGYTFKMSPCAHGMRGKDLTCPECGVKHKRIDDYGCEGHCSPKDCAVYGK